VAKWLTSPSVSHHLRFGGPDISLSMCFRDVTISIHWKFRQVIERPERRQVQPDGRIRLWGYASSLGGYLRVVVLSDGETVHNAFHDEDYE
jgi:hypothetical protein